MEVLRLELNPTKTEAEMEKQRKKVAKMIERFETVVKLIEDHIPEGIKNGSFFEKYEALIRLITNEDDVQETLKQLEHWFISESVKSLKKKLDPSQVISKISAVLAAGKS